MKQSNYLKFTIQPENDGTCELHVEFQANGFTGSSSGWFNLSEIYDFAQKLKAYPLPADQEIQIEGGHGDDEQNVSVKFYTINPTGVLGCRVETVTPNKWAIRPESRHSATGEIEINYNLLENFATEIEEIILQKKPSAHLQGAKA